MQVANLIAGAPALNTWLITGSGLTLFAVLFLALRHRTAGLTHRLAELEIHQQQLARDLRVSEEHARGLAAQIEQINVEIGRVDGAGLRLGLREAIALSRRGADPRELVNTCGIGDGEARLIALMHGRRTVIEAEPGDSGMAIELS